jgi:hypothetical protein
MNRQRWDRPRLPITRRTSGEQGYGQGTEGPTEEQAEQ